MTVTREIVAVITYIAGVMVVQCTTVSPSDHLPSPTELSYTWIDWFTLNLTWTWQKPSGLPPQCQVIYEVKNLQTNRSEIKTHQYYKGCLEEGNRVAHWRFSVKTLPILNEAGTGSLCAPFTQSEPVTIELPKDKELVTDFKCFFYSSDTMNCSWFPVKQTDDLRVFFRLCSSHESPFKVCEQPYSSGMRRGCYLKSSFNTHDICMVVNEASNPAGGNLFKRNPLNSLKPPPPKLNITAEGDHLILRWTRPHVASKHCWNYTIRYRKCNEPEKDLTVLSSETKTVSYDKHCRYEFRIRAEIIIYCGKGQSDFSEVEIYGADESRDMSLTVVLVIVPVLLSLCVILSCYCFRKHSKVICPIIPDPSVTFKEMMNGNKEAKTTAGSLYIPVAEAIEPLRAVEPCRITYATENSSLQQHS